MIVKILNTDYTKYKKRSIIFLLSRDLNKFKPTYEYQIFPICQFYQEVFDIFDFDNHRDIMVKINYR